MKDWGQNKPGEVTVFLRNYNGSTYTEIANGTVLDSNWQGGTSTWRQKTIIITGVNYNVPAGNRLEVKLIVGANAGDDMWFAYDTTAYPSVLRIPKYP